jgi:hypothetical protein
VRVCMVHTHARTRARAHARTLAHADTACSRSHQNMSFVACATRDLGAMLGGAGAARRGDGGGICAGSERNADMGDGVRDVARALLRHRHLVEYGTWHVRFCELTGGAEFLIPCYSEAHSGQARTRSSGARTSSRGAPRFRLGYARARSEGARRTGAFQGDGDEDQTICNYYNTRLDVRVQASWRHFFFSDAYTVRSCDIDTLLARSSGKWPRALGHMLGLRARSQRHGQLKSCATGS